MQAPFLEMNENVIPKQQLVACMYFRRKSIINEENSPLRRGLTTSILSVTESSPSSETFIPVPLCSLRCHLLLLFNALHE